MKRGARPTRIKHTDYDFLKSHRFGSITAADAQFPDEFLADAGRTMPNQETQDADFTPPTPPMPFGCTNFTNAELKTDLTGVIHSPADVESVTHANALGGYDIRLSLDACTMATLLHPNRLSWFSQYFNIRASGALDFFDSFRLTQIAGVSVGEKRSISWGTPWFPSWEQACLTGQMVMPMPTLQELQNVSSTGWHDSKFDGWKIINNVAMYRDKSWQGNKIGDQGFIYFPREVINRVMMISGTVAFTATNKPVNSPLTINVTTLQWLISALRNLIQKYSPLGTFS